MFEDSLAVLRLVIGELSGASSAPFPMREGLARYMESEKGSWGPMTAFLFFPAPTCCAVPSTFSDTD